MSATLDSVEFCYNTCLREELMEMNSLAIRHYVVCCSVEHNDRRVGRINISCSIESLESLLVTLERESHHGLFRSVIPAVFVAAAHIMKVCRT